MTLLNYAVIGANYGDEGKGHLVDFIVSRMEAPNKVAVVRYNGGAQAGHTVVSGTDRHVFSHFGAGSLLGATTYLSKFFVINPILFWNEHKLLSFPKLQMHPECLVTTPFDIMVNQEVERRRGVLRHGSCGVGFNTTIARSLVADDSVIFANDIKSLQYKRVLTSFREKLKHALDFSKKYLISQKIELPHYMVSSNEIEERFTEDCMRFADVDAELCAVRSLQTRSVVFEGAQGLALDMDKGMYPHVTRSNTGLKNIVALAGKRQVEVVYVTRAYLTRHGAGRLETEQTEFTPRDKTNVTNEFQGALRYGWLDIDALHSRISDDLIYVGKGYTVSIALTCLDQIKEIMAEGKYYVVCHGRKKAIGTIEELVKLFDYPVRYLSYGPDRKDIIVC
jgi:adenylosuccinate synthase